VLVALDKARVTKEGRQYLYDIRLRGHDRSSRIKKS
jgi:hypothetical protein